MLSQVKENTMRFTKKTTAVFLAFLFAFAPLSGGVFSQAAFAEDDFIESPILPIIPSGSEDERGIVYALDDETATAAVIDFTDLEAESVLIPERVTFDGKDYAVKTVASAAFSASAFLVSVAIPATVESVEAYAFDACTSLVDVWYEGDAAAFDQIRIAQGNEAFTSAKVHCGACMSAQGPDYVHTYDSHTDAVCNACGESRSTDENFVAGDLDSVEGVDVEDAIYLLFHVNFGDRYAVNQDVDYDRSGVIDMDDVFYLLYHVNFPERYPLA